MHHWSSPSDLESSFLEDTAKKKKEEIASMCVSEMTSRGFFLAGKKCPVCFLSFLFTFHLKDSVVFHQLGGHYSHFT